ncbi:MAG: hypothetical protein ACOYT4_04940 [Nanoarchaeota archaeon]
MAWKKDYNAQRAEYLAEFVTDCKNNGIISYSPIVYPYQGTDLLIKLDILSNSFNKKLPAKWLEESTEEPFRTAFDDTPLILSRYGSYKSHQSRLLNKIPFLKINNEIKETKQIQKDIIGYLKELDKKGYELLNCPKLKENIRVFNELRTFLNEMIFRCTNETLIERIKYITKREGFDNFLYMPSEKFGLNWFEAQDIHLASPFSYKYKIENESFKENLIYNGQMHLDNGKSYITIDNILLDKRNGLILSKDNIEELGMGNRIINPEKDYSSLGNLSLINGLEIKTLRDYIIITNPTPFSIYPTWTMEYNTMPAELENLAVWLAVHRYKN